MARLTAAQVGAKYKKNAMGAAGDYVTGVKAVTVSPSALAVKQQDKMLQNITEAITSGKWARKLGAVTLEDWIAKTVAKGSTRYTAGVQLGEGKMVAFMDKFLPHLDAGKAKIDAMPDMTIEDSIARAAAQIRYNHAYKG